MSAINPPVEKPAESVASEGSSPMCTVLVVDDSAVDRHMAGAIAQKMEGWQVSFASNGREALEALRQRTPDVVLTDLQMPEMDGLELVQAIHAEHPLVPVILMTAHGSEDLAIKALQSGAASYVPKKCLARDLADTLEGVLIASQTNRREQRVLDSLVRHETQFALDNDVAVVAPLVGQLEHNLERHCAYANQAASFWLALPCMRR